MNSVTLLPTWAYRTEPAQAFLALDARALALVIF
jgi:hypothetical protein